MRRGTMLVLGLLATTATSLTAMPQPAEARPMILKVLRGMATAPLGILGAGRRAARPSVHRRSHAGQSRPSRSAQSARPAAAGAVAGGAAATATAAATTGTTSAETTASAGSRPNDATNPDNAMAAAPAPGARQTSLASSTEEQLNPKEPRGPRGQAHFGAIGPQVWPTAYEDLVGFALWPKDHRGQFQAHGIGDIVATAFEPSAALTANARSGGPQARAGKPDQALSTGPSTTASGCSGLDLTASDWPIAQLSGASELSDEQKSALDGLRSALNQGAASIKASCRNDAQTPLDRLRAMQATLWAVHDAAQIIRAPLARFYETLSEQQRQQFALPASQASARLCGMASPSDAAARQIERELRLTKPQAASFDAFQRKTSEMGQFLMASCMKPVPGTPTERLDAATDRLTAVIFAASNITIALSDFTNQLSDGQKTKMNAMIK